MLRKSFRFAISLFLSQINFSTDRFFSFQIFFDFILKKQARFPHAVVCSYFPPQLFGKKIITFNPEVHFFHPLISIHIYHTYIHIHHHFFCSDSTKDNKLPQRNIKCPKSPFFCQTPLPKVKAHPWCSSHGSFFWCFGVFFFGFFFCDLQKKMVQNRTKLHWKIRIRFTTYPSFKCFEFFSAFFPLTLI